MQGEIRTPTFLALFLSLSLTFILTLASPRLHIDPSRCSPSPQPLPSSLNFQIHRSAPPQDRWQEQAKINQVDLLGDGTHYVCEDFLSLYFSYSPSSLLPSSTHSVPMLHLLTGKIGAGKSSFSRALSHCLASLPPPLSPLEVLSCDEWVLHLFPTLPVDNFQDVGPQVKSLILDVTERLLNHNASVLLDFSFWSRKERDDVRERFSEFGVRTWYVQAPSEDIRIQRVIQRNKKIHDIKGEREKEEGRKVFHVEPSHALMTSSFFEVPTEAEGDVVYVVSV